MESKWMLPPPPEAFMESSFREHRIVNKKLKVCRCQYCLSMYYKNKVDYKNCENCKVCYMAVIACLGFKTHLFLETI